MRLDAQLDPATDTPFREPKPQQLPQISCHSHKSILRSVFGRTKRSPMLWGIPDNLGWPQAKVIQSWHRVFWKEKGKNKHDRSDSCSLLNENKASQVTYSQWSELWRLSKMAYRINSNSEAGEEFLLFNNDVDLEPSPVLYQLQQVERAIWENLGQAPVHQPTWRKIRSDMDNLLREVLDTDGTPAGSIVSDIGLLAASWCRCHALLLHLGFTFNTRTNLLLNRLSVFLLRLRRQDGSLMLDSSGKSVMGDSFWRSIRKLGQQSDAKLIQNRGCSTLSEWAQVAVFQRSWKSCNHKVAATFDQRRIRLEIRTDRTVVCGDCTPQLKVNGQQQSVTSEIGVCCYLESKKASYLELELEFGDVDIQRQIIFLQDDRYLLVNDNVIGTRVANIEYIGRYSLPNPTEIRMERETRELSLVSDGCHTLVIPLALPEWKLGECCGALTANQEFLELRQSIHAQAMSAPVLFDLNPKRSQLPRTWRQLTVAEKLQKIPHDRAVAYRFQLGRRQWLFYRSLGEKGSRTFMGQNFADEFFLGQIRSDGNVKPLLEVE